MTSVYITDCVLFQTVCAYDIICSIVDQHIPVFVTLCMCVLLHHSGRQLMVFILNVAGCMNWGLHEHSYLVAAFNS